MPRRGTTIISPPSPENRGYVWMTVPKNYRSISDDGFRVTFLIDVLFRASSDDGLISGLILGPLITSAMYYVALKVGTPLEGTHHPPLWHIEDPWRLNNDTSLTPLQALTLSRRNAVDLSTLCSTTLLIHVYASHWFEWRHRKYHKVSENERGSVPRSEVRKGKLYIAFTFLVCAFLLGLRFALDRARVGLWRREFPSPLTPTYPIYDVMNTRPVVLGGRVGFCLFSVFAVHRRPTRSSWFHTRRAWLGGIRRHCVVHRIGQLDRCEGTHRFWMRLHMSVLTPPANFPRNRYGP